MMSTRRHILRTAAGVTTITLFLSGCAYLKELIGLGLEKPVVKLKTIQVRNITMNSIDLLATLNVMNPNDFDLKLHGLEYTVSAEEAKVAFGSYAEKFVAPKGGEAEIKIPFTLDNNAALQLIKRYLESPQKTSLLINARFMFTTPLGDMSMDFTDEKPLSKMLN